MPIKTATLPYRRVYTGMPVYNGEDYLEQSIRSNLNQTFDDHGLIITDNASTDRTEQICRDLAASDSRVYYIRNPENVGAARNYEKCFRPANCEYFRWSNGDDLIDPPLIEKCVEILDQHKAVVLTYGKTRLIDAAGEFIKNYDDNMHLSDEKESDRFRRCRNKIGLSNILYGLMRHDKLANTSLFGNYVASDINLIAELTLYGQFYEIPETLFSRRMHDNSSSADRDDNELQRSFWDPTKPRLFMQMWRSQIEYYKGVSRAPIPASEKRKLYLYLNKTIYWQKGALCKEIIEYCRFGLFNRPKALA